MAAEEAAEILNESDALGKISLAIINPGHAEACCAFAGLQAAGWKIIRRELSHGFCLIFEEPHA